MKQRKIFAADLFCGAGGFSSGLLDAAQRLGYDVELLAVAWKSHTVRTNEYFSSATYEKAPHAYEDVIRWFDGHSLTIANRAVFALLDAPEGGE